MANSLKKSEIMLGQRFKDCFKANIGNARIVSKQLEDHTQDRIGYSAVTCETTIFDASQREINNDPHAKSKVVVEIPEPPGPTFPCARCGSLCSYLTGLYSHLRVHPYTYI